MKWKAFISQQQPEFLERGIFHFRYGGQFNSKTQKVKLHFSISVIHTHSLSFNITATKEKKAHYLLLFEALVWYNECKRTN